MKLKEIIDIIEREYPPELAYDWDNAGLFYGDREREITKIITTLDITPDVIRQAKEKGAELIVSHHPLIMSGVKKLSDNSLQTELITEVVKNDICIYSAHTNMDTAKKGVNYELAKIFDLENVIIMVNDKPYDDCGLGRVGDLKEEMSLDDFCEEVKKRLETPFVRVCGKKEKVKRVAVASGSCAEFVPVAIEKGADVIVTGDMKYHNCIEFVHDGIIIIDAGHYPTEMIVKDIFKNLLANTGVEIIKADTEDIFRVE